MDEARWDHGGFEELEREYQNKQRGRKEKGKKTVMNYQVHNYSALSTQNTSKVVAREEDTPDSPALLHVQVSPSHQLSLRIGSLTTLDSQLTLLLKDVPWSDPLTLVSLKLAIVR